MNLVGKFPHCFHQKRFFFYNSPSGQYHINPRKLNNLLLSFQAQRKKWRENTSSIEAGMCPNHTYEDNGPFPWNHHSFSPRKSWPRTHGFPTRNVLSSSGCYWIPNLINKFITAYMCSEQTSIGKCTQHANSTMKKIILCTTKEKVTLFRTRGASPASVFPRREKPTDGSCIWWHKVPIRCHGRDGIA